MRGVLRTHRTLDEYIGHAQRSCAEHNPRDGQDDAGGAMHCIVGDMPTPPSNRSLVGSHFETLSAVLAGKADLRQALYSAP